MTQRKLIYRIKKLCELRGYDYITLARKSKVPLTTLLNIVKGNVKNPGLFTIIKLCKGLEVETEVLFYRTDKFSEILREISKGIYKFK